MATMAVQIAGSFHGMALRIKPQRVERRRKLRLSLSCCSSCCSSWSPSSSRSCRMMFRAIYDDPLLTLVPRTTPALGAWGGKDLPKESELGGGQ